MNTRDTELPYRTTQKLLGLMVKAQADIMKLNAHLYEIQRELETNTLYPITSAGDILHGFEEELMLCQGKILFATIKARLRLPTGTKKLRKEEIAILEEAKRVLTVQGWIPVPTPIKFKGKTHRIWQKPNTGKAWVMLKDGELGNW